MCIAFALLQAWAPGSDAPLAAQAALEQLQAAVDAAAPLAADAAPVAADAAAAREVVAHAHRLSYTTAPPPHFVLGRTPLGHFKPPAPQDLQLRSSQLHQFQREC